MKPCLPSPGMMPAAVPPCMSPERPGCPGSAPEDADRPRVPGRRREDPGGGAGGFAYWGHYDRAGSGEPAFIGPALVGPAFCRGLWTATSDPRLRTYDCRFDTGRAAARIRAGRTSGRLRDGAPGVLFLIPGREVPELHRYAGRTRTGASRGEQQDPVHLRRWPGQAAGRARRAGQRPARGDRPANPRRQGARRPRRERRVRGRQERAGVRRGPDPAPGGPDQERHHHRRATTAPIMSRSARP